MDWILVKVYTSITFSCFGRTRAYECIDIVRISYNKFSKILIAWFEEVQPPFKDCYFSAQILTTRSRVDENLISDNVQQKLLKLIFEILNHAFLNWGVCYILSTFTGVWICQSGHKVFQKPWK